MNERKISSGTQSLVYPRFLVSLLASFRFLFNSFGRVSQYYRCILLDCPYWFLKGKQGRFAPFPLFLNSKQGNLLSLPPVSKKDSFSCSYSMDSQMKDSFSFTVIERKKGKRRETLYSWEWTVSKSSRFMRLNLNRNEPDESSPWTQSLLNLYNYHQVKLLH